MNKQKLEKENEDLKMRLSVAEKWMQREVKSQIQSITKEKIKSNALVDKQNFFSENIEEIVTTSVTSFFWELMLLNTPKSVIENILSAEIMFYNLWKNNSADWLWVITSYHKSIDVMIESTITKWFRKFAKKAWQNQLRKNDPLEKTLNSVVNKGYILWIWKLFHIITNIKNDKELYDYGKCFKDYLDKFYFIKDILLEDKFFDVFEKIVWSEILWRKRHFWKIWFNETKEARALLIWDLKEKNCMIYKFIKMWQPDF